MDGDRAALREAAEGTYESAVLIKEVDLFGGGVRFPDCVNRDG
jgi:hypothetical protein